MDEEQFERLLDSITRSQDDHDTLIEIKTTLQNFTGGYHKTRQEDLERVIKSEASSTAAHKRIDNVIIIGGITVFLTVGSLILTAIYQMVNHA